MSTVEQAETKAAVQDAIDLPRITMTEMATALGMPRRTLDSYRKGERNMPPEARRALVARLQDHILDLRDTVKTLKATIPKRRKGSP